MDGPLITGVLTCTNYAIYFRPTIDNEHESFVSTNKLYQSQSPLERTFFTPIHSIESLVMMKPKQPSAGRSLSSTGANYGSGRSDIQVFLDITCKVGYSFSLGFESVVDAQKISMAINSMNFTPKVTELFAFYHYRALKLNIEKVSNVLPLLSTEDIPIEDEAEFEVISSVSVSDHDPDMATGITTESRESCEDRLPRSGSISSNTAEPNNEDGIGNTLPMVDKDTTSISEPNDFDADNSLPSPIHVPILVKSPISREAVFLPTALNGWDVFSYEKEFSRMNLPCADFRLTFANRDYKLCSTYPSVLCVPKTTSFSDRDLAAVATFRSKARLPTLCWKSPNPAIKATIWRCSQPNVGILGARLTEDERLFEYIGQSSGHPKNLVYIIDCRPKQNATGNKVAGKGFEEMSNYKNCNIQFMTIHNIHVVRDSFNKYVRLLAAWSQAQSLSLGSGMAISNGLGLGGKPPGQFYIDLAGTSWHSHLQSILRAVHIMVRAIDIEGAPVVCHCSDGWDRTSQLCALAKLCLDPYYRTIKGFAVLVEHEFCAFGHKFHERAGHGVAKMHDQRSPVFQQFLDSVYQLTRQFPRHFEFNSEFLCQVSHHHYSCRFGTFLFDNERERKAAELEDKTTSLWTFFLASQAAIEGQFHNGLYAGADGNPSSIDVQWPLHQNTEEADSASASISDPLATSRSPLATLAGDDLDYPYTKGTILYPSYAARRMEIWWDCYTRSYKEEAETVPYLERYLSHAVSNSSNQHITHTSTVTATSAAIKTTDKMVSRHLLWARVVAKEATEQLQQSKKQVENLQSQNETLVAELETLRLANSKYQQLYGTLTTSSNQ